MKKFKNDKERIAFLDDYRNLDNGWQLWKDDRELDRRWWRLSLGINIFVVEEQRITYHYPETHVTWDVMHWYVIDDIRVSQPFSDFRTSKSIALKVLKQIEKEMNRGTANDES